MSPTDSLSGQAVPNNAADPYSAMMFVIRQYLTGVRTTMLVQVKAVTNSGGVTPVGKVDVQPLVHQVDANGEIVPHGTVYGMPYMRIQGGTNAVILDPQVGDIGLAVMADRDISAVVSTKAAAAPGSNRRNNFSDGLYIGGFLNGTPTQYVQFSGAGIEVLSPTKVTIHAPTVAVEGNMTVTGSVVAQGEVTGNGVALSTHVHSGVQSGSGTSGPPIP